MQFENITIALSHSPATASLYIAKDNGYFREEGIVPVFNPYPSGHMALDAVLSGKAVLATVGDTPFVQSILGGNPAVLVATICRINRAIAIVARRDRGISTHGDLRHKTIGRDPDTTADFFLDIYLMTHYIDPTEVTLVDLSPDRIVDTLLKGEIDAVSTWSPHIFELQTTLGDNFLVLDDPDIYTMTWNVVTTRDLVRIHSDLLEKFLRALLKANEFIESSPARARAIAAKHIGDYGRFFANEWKNYSFTLTLDQSLILNLEDQARWMLKEKGRSTVRIPNFLDAISPRSLSHLSPELVRIVGE